MVGSSTPSRGRSHFFVDFAWTYTNYAHDPSSYLNWHFARSKEASSRVKPQNFGRLSWSNASSWKKAMALAQMQAPKEHKSGIVDKSNTTNPSQAQHQPAD